MQSRAHLNLIAFATTLWLALCFLRLHAFPFPIPFADPNTDQRDVDAINDLYAALGSPELDGWTNSGGDPCTEAWQGVQCDGPNITAIELPGAGLGGKLSRAGETLGRFTALEKLDLSSNELSGELPDSMAKLSSLSTFHVQNNKLTGTLDVLVDLPLKDLNVENNLFSGPIPEKLLSIPKFLRDGNHFTVPPPIPGSSPTPSTPSPPNHAPAPPADQEPPVLSGSHPPIYVIPAPPQVDAPRHGSSKVSPVKAAGFSILAAGSLGVTVVAIAFVVSKRRREGSPERGVEMRTPSWAWEGLAARTSAVSKPDKERRPSGTESSEEKKELPPGDHGKESVASDKNVVQGISSEVQPSRFAFTFFTVASLQQYTYSFSDRNLVRETCFGKIYLAEFQENKFAVLKLDCSTARMPVAEFLKIVQGVADLRHPNVEELVGCCVDHGQRLLVYRHFSDNTLSDLIHSEHTAERTPLPWDARVAAALEAAKALEYLHEGSQKQVVHRHFTPEHVLVDGDLRVSVSGGGLAPFAPPSGAAPQLSNYSGGMRSDEPQEAEAAAWTSKGDVYSFGVVMLQLLTGRKPYDSSRARGERHLVPWASPRLHDLAALRTMADPRLGRPPPVRSLSRFADIIGRCIQQEAEFRPGMSQVVQDLRRALDDARAGSGAVIETDSSSVHGH